MNLGLAGKTALVTASSGGLGEYAARALADAFAPIDLDAEVGADLPFDVSMLSGPRRTETPVRSATPLVSGAVAEPDTTLFSFDRFFPDPATAAPTSHETPARAPVVPAPLPAAEMPPTTVSDDLAQFSAWLKGLGNV